MLFTLVIHSSIVHLLFYPHLHSLSWKLIKGVISTPQIKIDKQSLVDFIC